MKSMGLTKLKSERLNSVMNTLKYECVQMDKSVLFELL